MGPATPNIDARLEKVAKERFGIERLHPEQLAAMRAVMEGRDTMVVMPTGFGKSLIYQVPAMLRRRPTIVVSPLIALMADQEQSLKKRGIPVVRIDSTLRAAERRAAYERLEARGTLIVLTTPETLESPGTRPLFEKTKPALLCVDEAHCISEWGHDFRPAYLRLGTERKGLGKPPMLALTATATQQVRDDISERLQLEDPIVITAPPHRKNLVLGARVVPGDQKLITAAKYLKRLQRPGIVYCATTIAVDNLTRALDRARIPAAKYHGKMSAPDRAAAQKRYMKPSKRLVMVATSAFGMGIDKPNIRYVLHYHAPGSLEQYVQEFGRAGRDGRRSDCILLFDPDDLSIQTRLQSRSRPRTPQLLRVAEALAAWTDESKPVTASALAISAETGAAIAGSLLAKLEAIGVAERDPKGRWTASAGKEELIKGARDLAGRIETLKRQDSERLRIVADYARAEDICRSVYIRKYFGEDNPPICEKCDHCRRDPDVQAKRAQEQKSRRTRGKRGGRGRSRRKKAPATATATAGTADEANGEAAPAKKKRRRRRRRRGRGGKAKTQDAASNGAPQS